MNRTILTCGRDALGETSLVAQAPRGSTPTAVSLVGRRSRVHDLSQGRRNPDHLQSRLSCNFDTSGS